MLFLKLFENGAGAAPRVGTFNTPGGGVPRAGGQSHQLEPVGDLWRARGGLSRRGTSVLFPAEKLPNVAPGTIDRE